MEFLHLSSSGRVRSCLMGDALQNILGPPCPHLQVPTACLQSSLHLTSMCSASQPSSFASRLAILRAKHFFPRSEFPPYPLPKEIISLRSGRCAMSVSSGLHGQLFTKGSAQEDTSQVSVPHPHRGIPRAKARGGGRGVKATLICLNFRF